MANAMNSLHWWEVNDVRPMWIISDDCASNLAACLPRIKTIFEDLNNSDSRMNRLFSRQKTGDARGSVRKDFDDEKKELSIKFASGILREIQRVSRWLDMAQKDYEIFCNKHLNTKIPIVKHSQTPST